MKHETTDVLKKLKRPIIEIHCAVVLLQFTEYSQILIYKYKVALERNNDPLSKQNHTKS